MSAIETDRFRQVLLEERERVARAIEHIHEEHPGMLEDEAGEEGGYDNHPSDIASATFDRELDYTLEENSEHVLSAIDAALRRIDEGTYGICVSCGKEIAPERLEARPWANKCIDCQRRDERG